jgi:hypothetical protein
MTAGPPKRQATLATPGKVGRTFFLLRPEHLFWENPVQNNFEMLARVRALAVAAATPAGPGAARRIPWPWPASDPLTKAVARVMDKLGGWPGPASAVAVPAASRPACRSAGASRAGRVRGAAVGNL